MKKGLKKFRNSLAAAAVACVRAFLVLVPVKIASAAGRTIGTFTCRFLEKERGIIRKNLDLVWPGKFTQRRSEEFALANFRNYGTMLLEFLKISSSGPSAVSSLVKSVSGLEYFEKSRREGKGLIAVTAHFGNWELMPLYLKMKGFDIGVIGKKMFDDSLDRQLSSARTKTGVKLFERDSIGKDMLKELKKGMILGILADHDTRGENVVVPFLGVPAKTPVMPARLAKKYGLYMCTAFITRDTDGLYNITVNPFIKNLETRSEEDIMTECAAEISKAVKAAPEQWTWVHDRYKSVRKAGA